MMNLKQFCKKAGFQDTLSVKCYEYLQEKESIGVKAEKPMMILMRFLRMCHACGDPLDSASKTSVERWNMKDPNETRETITIEQLKCGDLCDIWLKMA